MSDLCYLGKTRMLKPAYTETVSWVPSKNDDPLWIQDEHLFQQLLIDKFLDKIIYFSVLILFLVANDLS